jgi:hypothetical protein
MNARTFAETGPPKKYGVCSSVLAVISENKRPYVHYEQRFLPFLKDRITFIDSDHKLESPGKSVVGPKDSPRLKFEGSVVEKGTFMFVINTKGELIIGTRADNARHPNLIGGENPEVLAAGDIIFEGGLIREIKYQQSHHYEPGRETRPLVEHKMSSEFPPKLFHPDFKYSDSEFN